MCLELVALGEAVAVAETSPVPLGLARAVLELQG
jgi:hypothetical protein